MASVTPSGEELHGLPSRAAGRRDAIGAAAAAHFARAARPSLDVDHESVASSSGRRCSFIIASHALIPARLSASRALRRAERKSATATAAVDAAAGPSACLELAVVVSELCTNLLKYDVRGNIDARPLCGGWRGIGLERVARDEGLPFHDLSIALCDGCDDRGPIDAPRMARQGNLGAGLGAIVRFTDELRVEPEPAGKRIIVRRYRER